MSEGNETDTPPREVPVDWEALEDAFENNAPEVHSYLQLASGEVLRVVDGIADPDMHSRIAGDAQYLRIESVSSREQYRWMERFIQMVDEVELRSALGQAIDGKGAFRRFKDVLMGHAGERERWFSFRSERLRVFMEAWLAAHALTAVVRKTWEDNTVDEQADAPAPTRRRTADALRRQIRESLEGLGTRDLDSVAAFADFLKARRAARAAGGAELSSALGHAPPERPADDARADTAPSSEPRKVTLIR